MPTSTNVPRRLRCRVATGTNTLAKRNGPASRSNCRAEPNHARMLTAATVHTANAIVGLIDVTVDIAQPNMIDRTRADVANPSSADMKPSHREGIDIVKRLEVHASRPFHNGTNRHCSPPSTMRSFTAWVPPESGTTIESPRADATRTSPTWPATVMSRPLPTVKVPAAPTLR